MIIGIDPGQKGALVCLTERREVVHCWRGDELRVKGDTEMNDRLALDALETCVNTNGGVELVVLERQWARPGQGVKSQSQIVGEYRAWRALCVSLGIATITPTPRQWQKVLQGTAGEGKSRSVRFVQQLIPSLDLTPGRRTKPHDGLSDAASMSLYGFWKGPTKRRE